MLLARQSSLTPDDIRRVLTHTARRPAANAPTLVPVHRRARRGQFAEVSAAAFSANQSGGLRKGTKTFDSFHFW
ncbi:MAG: hypothetical protein WDN48_12870 [Pseudolabrys sp.]